MPKPRLVQASCPGCGAALRIAPTERIVTCGYCQSSSFVHLPHETNPPAPRPDQKASGHIHISREALGAVGTAAGAAAAGAGVLVIVAVALAGLLAVTGVVVAILVVGSSRPTFAPPPVSSGPVVIQPADVGKPSSASCELTVRCCKAVMTQTQDPSAQRSCDAMRALPVADCARQAESLRRAASALGKTCD